MNPDKPSRDEIEVKLTALLLGELPDDEAKLLRWTISQDAELQRLHRELASAIVLVREAEKNPAAAPGEKTVPLKLSDERRKKLLAHFKTPRPQESFWIKRLEIPSLVTVLALVAVMAVLAAMLLPSLASAKKKAQRVTTLSGSAMKELQGRTWGADNSERLAMQTPAAAPADASTFQTMNREVTVAPEPMLVPPPTEIVLPRQDLAETALEQTKIPNESGKGGVYSASVVDYSVVTAPAQVAQQVAPATLTVAPSSGAVANADHFYSDEFKAGNVPIGGLASAAGDAAGLRYTFGSGAGGGGGSGGAGGAGGGSPQPQLAGNFSSGVKDGWRAESHLTGANQNNAPLGWDSSDTDRSQLKSQPKMIGRGFSIAGPIETAGATLDFQADTSAFHGATLPGEKAAGTPVNLGEISVSSEQLVTAGIRKPGTKSDGFDFNLGDVAVAQNRVGDEEQLFKNKTREIEIDSDKTPVSGDVPMLGRVFASGSAGTPASTIAPVPPGTPVEVERKRVDFSANPPVVLAETPQRLPQSGGDTLTLNGGNTFSRRTAGSGDRLALGVNKDDHGILLHANEATMSRSRQLADDKKSGAKADFEATVAAVQTTNAIAFGSVAPRAIDPATGLPTATLDQVQQQTKQLEEESVAPKISLPAPIPQPEIQTRENNFSTFSLNVSDVSFKLAAASLERGQMPDAASIRSEEFINAFDYRDPEAAAGEPIAFASERARYPFAHNRDLLRFSVKTAAAGRPAGRALNLVLLLDNSGSMERADRVAIIREALRVLATQLQPQDTVSVVTFARTARLWADGVSGKDAGAELEKIGGLTPQGGTNLEEAMRLAYETARRHYLASGLNRVVLLTDGAANLGNVDAAVLKEKVEAQRKQGIALDCFGIGWEGFNDDTLEQLSRNGDGRYAFINSLEDASKEFAAKLAGALSVAASDVKVQVEFNPQRVISYRQIGYAKHQLTKEQFRDNTVDAAEIAAQEAGNALYTVETKPDGTGPVATVRVRYKIPGTTDYRERSWDVPYMGNAPALEQSSAAMRLAATASAFSEWLASSPFAQEVSPNDLLKGLSGVPQIYGADERPKKLEWMIRQAKSLSGK